MPRFGPIRQISKETDVPDKIHIVFDGPPDRESGRFVEVETPEGKSLAVGRWEERDDNLWHLIIDLPEVSFCKGQEAMRRESAILVKRLLGHFPRTNEIAAEIMDLPLQGPSEE